MKTSVLPWLLALVLLAPAAHAEDFTRVRYHHPGLTVDLGVGLWAWPLPMDYDGDGDMDLLVSCPDKPSNGVYFFENPQGRVKMPVFKPGVRLAPAQPNVQISYVAGQPRLLVPGAELIDFRKEHFARRKKVYPRTRLDAHKVRANQWKFADFDGDGDQDLLVGVGDWSDYGWDNAFDKRGVWTRGPLHGWVYLLRNTGSDAEPRYADPVKIEAGGKPVDVFGMPSPNLADFDGDGDLDLLCGEFIDGFTYFPNVGTRKDPKYAAGRRLPLRMDLCMIVPVAVDWDGDGDTDLVVGEEDGRVALIEHTGKVKGGLPVFAPPRHFQQQAEDVKFGALVTPVSFDWDGDGDEDLICGNTAGYVGFIENLDGKPAPRWAAPRYLEADGRVIRIMAGPNGSIQGPCERKWGYTTLSVADWNHDGLPDLVVNSIWGKVVWFANVGTRKKPRLTSARPIEVEWEGKPPRPAWNWWEPQGRELVTQWRTTPCALDLTGDGLVDLAMLDHEGYLALFRRVKQGGRLRLLPGKRVFVDEKGKPLRLNAGVAGKSGRRKLCFADWDGDGRVDLLVNTVNAGLFRNLGTRPDGSIVLKDEGPVGERKLSGHTTSPAVADWDRDGVPDLLVGAEDGHLYHLRNPRAK
jgi:hypothetical protein